MELNRLPDPGHRNDTNEPAGDHAPQVGAPWAHCSRRRWTHWAGSFARVINGRGASHCPPTLSIDAGETVHFNSADLLEDGNAGNRLAGSRGPGQGDWRLELDSSRQLGRLPTVVGNGRYREFEIKPMVFTPPTGVGIGMTVAIEQGSSP